MWLDHHWRDELCKQVWFRVKDIWAAGHMGQLINLLTTNSNLRYVSHFPWPECLHEMDIIIFMFSGLCQLKMKHINCQTD